METLTYIVGLLQRVHPTVGKLLLAAFSACIGALFALSGVILTNRAHDRRLRVQLDHDKAMKNRDREMGLRKEVYLAALEALSAGLTAITRHNDLAIDHDKLLEDYVGKSPVLGKIHVVAWQKHSECHAVIFL